MRTASLILLSGLFVQVAHADEIRHTTFPNAMLGTWAETAEQCAAKDKTNIVIEPAKYRDGGGDFSCDEELSFCGMLHNGSRHSPKSASHSSAHSRR
jgi:hypothetical protein